MASSSSCFVVVFVAILSQFLLVSASTKPIDAICQRVTNKAFCIKTLTAYPPAASGITMFEVTRAAINIAKSYADKCRKFSVEAAKENPKLNKLFMECEDSFHGIIISLKSAAGELKTSQETSYYNANVCADFVSYVTGLVVKNKDEASKTIVKMTLTMNKLIDIARGAIDAVCKGEP